MAHRTPDINAMLAQRNRVEERASQEAEAFDDEEEEAQFGKFWATMEDRTDETWRKLTNFTQAQIVELYEEAYADYRTSRSRGPKPKIPMTDAILMLLTLYSGGGSIEILSIATKYGLHATRTALDRARLHLNVVLKTRWWTNRMRPTPLDSARFSHIALLMDSTSKMPSHTTMAKTTCTA
eukprot:TRINITY_DN9238_c0_g1_i1.p1 TRINITY_DN9238_c0_g1~~TRINITY_DN9238_c0_g1_i1.p1  ORF type:complete len:191 (+),score=27.00 TRINITY_DN9238_c0_g1_i1:33-575(+)